MSSKYVRDFARGKAATIAPLLVKPVPYYDTVNKEQNPSDSLWYTLSFLAYNKRVDNYCRETTEYGAINIIVFGNAGAGDSDVLSAAEDIASKFYASSDTSGRLVLVNCSAPEEFTSNNGSPNFIVSVGIDYEFYSN